MSLLQHDLLRLLTTISILLSEVLAIHNGQQRDHSDATSSDAEQDDPGDADAPVVLLVFLPVICLCLCGLTGFFVCYRVQQARKMEMYRNGPQGLYDGKVPKNFGGEAAAGQVVYVLQQPAQTVPPSAIPPMVADGGTVPAAQRSGGGHGRPLENVIVRPGQDPATV